MQSDSPIPQRRRILRRRDFLAATALSGLVAAPMVRAQDYPSRPVRILVGFAPGGTSDLLARFLAKGLGERLGQSFIVENRPGANGILGTEAAARAAPDGYTLLLGTCDTHAINPSLYKQLPYDPERDFTPVTLVGRLNFFLAAAKATPFGTAAEFVAHAKGRPQALTYASWGNGSTGHLAMEALASLCDIKLRHIPYKGMGLASQDLLSGHVDLMFAGPTLVPHLKSGAMKLLGFAGSARLPAFPQARTVAEQIGKPFVADSWYALYAPPGLPPPLVAKLAQASKEAVAGSAAAALLESQSGLAIETGAPAELAQLQRAELVRWREVIRTAGVML